jgi:hypothetical protein
VTVPDKPGNPVNMEKKEAIYESALSGQKAEENSKQAVC